MQKHDSAGSNDIEDGEDDDMHSDDSMDMMRLDSEICLPRGKPTQIWNLEPLMVSSSSINSYTVHLSPAVIKRGLIATLKWFNYITGKSAVTSSCSISDAI